MNRSPWGIAPHIFGFLSWGVRIFSSSSSWQDAKKSFDMFLHSIEWCSNTVTLGHTNSLIKKRKMGTYVAAPIDFKLFFGIFLPFWSTSSQIQCGHSVEKSKKLKLKTTVWLQAEEILRIGEAVRGKLCLSAIFTQLVPRLLTELKH